MSATSHTSASAELTRVLALEYIRENDLLKAPLTDESFNKVIQAVNEISNQVLRCYHDITPALR